jgi:predicted peptidase
MKKLAILFLLFTACATMPATKDTGFLNRTLTHAGQSYRYVVYVPEHDGSRPLPIALFLHGAGERGDDGMRQTAVGIGSAIRWSRERFPMIVVMPQAPADTQWLGDTGRAAMLALDAATREFGGDPARTYLTGLSLGGYGTWHLAMEHPDRFAALVPVCGGILKPETANSVRQSPLTAGAADPYAATAQKIRPGIPIWIFHGADDKVIPPTESRRMFAELQKLGANVRYTELPGVGHNAWDPAYGNPELWTWVLAQRLR